MNELVESSEKIIWDTEQTQKIERRYFFAEAKKENKSTKGGHS